VSAAGRRRPETVGTVGAPELSLPPKSFTPAWLAAQLRALIGPLAGRKLSVAYSGGPDSAALLAALASLRRVHRFVLRALHVHHGLQPGADGWAQHALAQAQQLRVPCELLRVTVVCARGESLEAAARAARYRALAQQLTAEELLLTAHHQEDQLETVLLALMRGSGVRGLGAMAPLTPWSGTLLVRPLLAVGRSQLERYGTERGLSWIDDPSNEDLRFDRSYLRARVVPLLRARWPSAAVTAARSAAHLREARALLEQLAAQSLREARDGTTLRVSALVRLALADRKNALRLWIAERGLSAPDYRRLHEIAGPMLAARADALPCVRWKGGELRRFGDRLFALQDPPAVLSDRDWAWRKQPRLEFADGSALTLARERHGDVQLSALPARLTVRFRRGGERLQSGSGHIALKQLLQTQAIPPWAREQVPLVAAGERIVAVADLWLHPAYRAREDTRSSERGRLHWQRLD
jgi:tRNA(Ile)-lysidine synthase